MKAVKLGTDKVKAKTAVKKSLEHDFADHMKDEAEKKKEKREAVPIDVLDQNDKSCILAASGALGFGCCTGCDIFLCLHFAVQPVSL